LETKGVQAHSDAIEDWVEVHPDIKSKSEKRLRNVLEANREWAFINAAKTGTGLHRSSAADCR